MPQDNIDNEMKINRQFQDLHTSGSADTDWCAVQSVERDICLLYHQLADYAYIMGDLYYGNVYSLPYWEYLAVSTLEPEQQQFIRIGCLVMLYAMASEVLDGSGTYLTMDRHKYRAAKSAVNALPEFDADTNRLIDAVRRSFTLIDQKRGAWEDSPEVQDVVAESTWIHERFVRQYFIRHAEQFNSNPYYRATDSDASGG